VVALDVQQNETVATIASDHHRLGNRPVRVDAEISDEISTGDATHRVSHFYRAPRWACRVHSTLRNPGIFWVLSSLFLDGALLARHPATDRSRRRSDPRNLREGDTLIYRPIRRELLDHLVGLSLEGERNRKPEGLGGSQIDHELELGGLRHGKSAGFAPPRTRSTGCRRVAPNARRSPSSRVCCMTVHDISPYTPTPASNKRKRFSQARHERTSHCRACPAARNSCRPTRWRSRHCRAPKREVGERRTAPGTNRRLNCKDQPLPAFFRASTWSASWDTRMVRPDSAWIT
jgi:hypothetical protein